MTLLMISTLSVFMVTRIYTIYTTREYAYTKRALAYTEEQMSDFNVSLGNFNQSLNFIAGLSGLDENFDILNNPYVKYSARSNFPTEAHPLTKEELYELEICS